MSNYIIEVSPDFQTWTQCVEDTDGLDFPNSLMQIDVCQNIVEGRWIRIKLQTLTMPLVLCEVQVLAEKENNIALNKVTLQSSKDVTQDFGDSFLANDGNTDGTVLGGSCTLTNNEPEPYWIVDFGESVSIKSVVIYNRVDASAIFLTDFVVEATNALDIENNELTPWKLCAGQRGGVDYGRQGQIITCPTHLMGRWLRVSLKSAGILSLCEVVVNGRDGCQVDQAECVDAIDGDISCKCREGLTGQYCNCPSDDICKYGECVDDPDGKFVCDCQRPFYGQYCGCRPGACSGHGFCTDVKGLVYTCECDAGFSGTFCACSNASCNGHGTCSSDLEKFVTCTCDAGYHGETCKCPDSTGPSCPNTSPNRKVTFTDAVQAIATQCALMLHKHAREYHAIAYFFNRDDIELPGIRFNFMQARKMEMQTKATIYELITTSGGCIVFGEVPAPVDCDWTILDALQKFVDNNKAASSCFDSLYFQAGVDNDINTQEFIDVHLILHRMKISAYGARALNTAKRFLLPTASPAKERLFDWMNSWWGYIPFIHFTTDKAAIKRMLKNAADLEINASPLGSPIHPLSNAGRLQDIVFKRELKRVESNHQRSVKHIGRLKNMEALAGVPGSDYYSQIVDRDIPQAETMRTTDALPLQSTLKAMSGKPYKTVSNMESDPLPEGPRRSPWKRTMQEPRDTQQLQGYTQSGGKTDPLPGSPGSNPMQARQMHHADPLPGSPGSNPMQASQMHHADPLSGSPGSNPMRTNQIHHADPLGGQLRDDHSFNALMKFIKQPLSNTPGGDHIDPVLKRQTKDPLPMQSSSHSSGLARGTNDMEVTQIREPSDPLPMQSKARSAASSIRTKPDGIEPLAGLPGDDDYSHGLISTKRSQALAGVPGSDYDTRTSSERKPQKLPRPSNLQAGRSISGKIERRLTDLYNRKMEGYSSGTKKNGKSTSLSMPSSPRASGKSRYGGPLAGTLGGDHHRSSLMRPLARDALPMQGSLPKIRFRSQDIQDQFSSSGRVRRRFAAFVPMKPEEALAGIPGKDHMRNALKRNKRA